MIAYMYEEFYYKVSVTHCLQVGGNKYEVHAAKSQLSHAQECVDKNSKEKTKR